MRRRKKLRKMKELDDEEDSEDLGENIDKKTLLIEGLFVYITLVLNEL
jgi:hypothetical protein